MTLKRAFAGFAALVVGLSFSPAFAATLLVDNFSNLGPLPTSNSTNTWSYSAPSGVLRNARDLTKSGPSSTAVQWTSQPVAGMLQLVTTTLGSPTPNTLTMRYDQNVGSATGVYFNPRVDASAFTGGWLNIATPSVAVGANTSAKATIEWATDVPGTPGVTIQSSELTLTGGPSNGGYAFKISSFAQPIGRMDLIASVTVRLQSLGLGTTLVNSIYFANAPIPEPGTLALAGLGLVGLVIARRKKSA